MSHITAADALAGTRNASLQDAVDILRAQQALKIDLVAPASRVRFSGGNLMVRDLEPQLTEDGVTDPNGTYVPTAAADADVAERIGMGVKYMRTLRGKGRTDLIDANINGMLGGRAKRLADGTTETVHPADDRSFLLRLFRGDESQTGEQNGILRAVLSDRYGRVDNLDLLMAVLSGVKDAGVEVDIRQCDLNDHFLKVRAYSPQVSALAPTLLSGYRNPFANADIEKARQEISRWRPVAEREGMGFEAGNEPVVFAGFEFSNSEIGHGSVTLRPVITVKVCRNGLTLPAFGTTRAHLGAKLEEGWNFEVQGKALAVVTAQAKQKVAEWLSSEFLAARVNELEAAAGALVTEPNKTMKRLARQFELTEAEQDGILAHFTMGGQATAGGIANAFTSYSQTIPDAERADALDAMAVSALMDVRWG